MDSETPCAPGANESTISSGASKGNPVPWRGRGTLLVVDDDQAVRTVLQFLLERCGFTVLTAADGRSAMETFRSRPGEIRLVLLDLVLPDVDREAVFRLMRKICPCLRAILCSGHLTETDLDARSAEGWAAVLRKPFWPELLLQTVRTALEN